ncbi:hypothetical protein [Candidatus Spongiihabitans sp.]|uniref:hypothetical protein n=1 Tax=Candidatus Spongiihabitans sp. TaxID=3101308 RepID=UPI003C70360B
MTAFLCQPLPGSGHHDKSMAWALRSVKSMASSTLAWVARITTFGAAMDFYEFSS